MTDTRNDKAMAEEVLARAALTSDVFWAGLAKAKREKQLTAPKASRGDSQFIVLCSPSNVSMLARAVIALTADLEKANADAVVLRKALIGYAYSQYTDGDGWGRMCNLCGEECRLPDREKLVHSVACPLSPTAGTDLLAELARLRHAVSLVRPLMERYEGQGEGGTAEFNIAMQALHEAARVWGKK